MLEGHPSYTLQGRLCVFLQPLHKQ
jgi:hypothetical protein